MKKVLLATSNKDKFKIVKYILHKAGLKENEYEILSLKDINYNGPDEKESGGIAERARNKAISVKENLSNPEEYEYIIGIDDGIELKGTVRENVKDHIKMILFENYLEEKESIIFPRAYCCIDKFGRMYETIAEIKYTYKHKDNLTVEPNSYPLSQVMVPIGGDRSLTEMSEEDADEYCWESCKDKVIEMVEKMVEKKPEELRKLNLIIIFSKDLKKALFCIRAKQPYKGMYNFVGGQVEPGETNDEAAYRELFEETGIRCDDVELDHFMDFNYYKYGNNLQVYYGILKHDVELVEEKNKLEWVDIGEELLDNSKFGGNYNIAHMIKQILVYLDNGTGIDKY